MIKSSPGKKGEDIPERKAEARHKGKKGGGNFKEWKFSEAGEGTERLERI